MDVMENGVLLRDFPKHFRLKNAHVPDNYLFSLNAAGISPTPVLNQIANAKERGGWIPCKL